jgi:hypothetical protein
MKILNVFQVTLIVAVAMCAGFVIGYASFIYLNWTALHQPPHATMMDMRAAMSNRQIRNVWQGIYCSPEHERQLLELMPLDADVDKARTQ